MLAKNMLAHREFWSKREVAGIAQARHDIGLLVQVRVDGCHP